jgi:2-keto-4-pentenoate hydratase/2-oxohepta-3-ene-1,7-dioic acid hydratase in catechol pathway
MRFCTFRVGGGRPRAGVVDGDRVRPVESASPETGGDPLKELLAAGALTELELGEPVALADVVLSAPVLRPDKFLCVGLNYRSHAEEAGLEPTEVPSFFVKLPNAIIGHEEDVPIPRLSHRIDWEGELAVVIGRRCADVTVSDAMDVVAGYTVTNDVTARDYQFKTSQWQLGKTFDGFAPLGPWITTLDELSDPQDVHLTTSVNGEVMQDARTSDLIFGVPELVSFFSSVMTLEAGDVIATGTPSGIGAMMRPRRWLREGDVVIVDIEGVGRLRNTVRGSR